MKKIKLIHISKTNVETLVATFNNINEAAQCRDLLQAKCADQDNSYYSIDFYDKKRKANVRQGADSFAKQVMFMHSGVQSNIRIFLS